MTNSIKVGRLTRIFIQGLFGFATYDIPVFADEARRHESASILYGDNGSGKTTILRLLFNLLSTRTGRGEKSLIARTPFKRFIVEFSGGTIVSAVKHADLVGPFRIEIEVPGSGTARFNMTLDPDGDVANTQETARCLNVLRTLEMQLLFLTDSRKILATSSYFEDPGRTLDISDIELHRWQSARGAKLGREERPFDVELVVARFRNAIREGLLRGSRDGETNANSTYIDLLEKVAIPYSDPKIGVPSTHQLIERVSELAKRGKQFAEYGIAESISEDRISYLLREASPDKLELLKTVLLPYLDGIEARLNALEPVETLVRNFVRVSQAFFGDKKRISFSIRQGLTIKDRMGQPVAVSVLSSGERHLLMLLCATVIARERATFFLIDEPELSLNIKWQRMLIDALQTCAEGSSIQFIVASHSLELLARYRSQTIKLEDMDA